MSRIQILLDADDWYEVIDALKSKEFEYKDHEKKALSFNRLSKEIYSQLYSGVFHEGYEYKEKELEREERDKLSGCCDF